MSGLEALAKRCEEAAEPDRELDADIHCAAHGWRKEWDEEFLFWRYWRDDRWISQASIPAYTASLDAAMTLVPEGRDWTCGSDNEVAQAVAGCAFFRRGSLGYIDTRAATPALALCAAALRAHLATDGGKTDA